MSFKKSLCIPFVAFLVLFVVLPIGLIVFYAFTNDSGSFSFDALVSFFTTPAKINVLLVSIFIGLQTTIICLLIGFPIAYFLANKKYNRNTILILLFIAPMWINFVLRTGATRDLLFWMGLSGGQSPFVSTIIGMVYNFLPFVILPLYTTMLKIDKSQIEASIDLGANPWHMFWKAIFPQTIPGLISAAMMVFMPTMSAYVISDVLSEGNVTLFGNLIYLNFSSSQWNEGSFLALVMLVLVGLTMLVSRRFEKTDARVGGMQW